MKIAIIHWIDASCHGNETYSDSEAKQRNLIKGVAVGIKVYEDKKKITIATDHFTEWNTWRTLSCYPKSGIKKIDYVDIKDVNDE